MLPMIITASLAIKVPVRPRKSGHQKLNAIQDLGSNRYPMYGQTETLTQDEIVLEYPLDIHGDLIWQS